jgi:hypothetical protein
MIISAVQMLISAIWPIIRGKESVSVAHRWSDRDFAGDIMILCLSIISGIIKLGNGLKFYPA